MYFATLNAVGNGTQTTWNINFTGGYIAASHLKAEWLDALGRPAGQITFTMPGPNQVRITPAPAAGQRFRIYRDTPKDTPLVDYSDGAVMTEKNLDLTTQQAIFATAEMVDRVTDATDLSVTAIGEANEASILAGGAQTAAINATTAANGAVQAANTASQHALAATGTAANAVATANAAADVADDARVTALGIESKADDALAAAGNAVQVANAATTTANQAKTTAQSASTAAGNATTAAQQAGTKADNATTTANTAKSTADSALSAANAATNTANNAATAAGQAQTTAGNAVTTANEAKTTANAAAQTASSAQTTAGNALTTAQGIDAKATSALSTANAASTTANEAKTTANGIAATANQAATDAASAKTTAQNAATAAGTATTTANTAKSTADTAKTTADNAATKANTADGKATTASTNASTALSTANTAKSTADNAATNAQTALTNASNALTAAQNAQQTADGVAGTADSALSTANAASTAAGNAQTTANSALSTAQGVDSKAQSALDLANSLEPRVIGENWFVNGNLYMWNWRTSASGTTSSPLIGFCAEMLKEQANKAATSVSLQGFPSGHTQVPNNPTVFHRYAVTAHSGSTDCYAMSRILVEDATRFSGRTITVSFWLKANASTQVSLEAEVFFGSQVGSPSPSINTIFPAGGAKFSVTTGWTKYVKTFTFPTLPSKNYGMASAVAFNIWYSAGSNYNSRTASLGVKTGTFDLAQIKVEDGPVATQFTDVHVEVAQTRCLRYFQMIKFSVDGPGAYSTQRKYVNFMVPMARNPTMGIPPETVEQNQIASVSWDSFSVRWMRGVIAFNGADPIYSATILLDAHPEV